MSVPLFVRGIGDTLAVFWPRPGCDDDLTVIAEVWEENVYRLSADMIGPGDIVVDAGANIGAFTILAARRGAHVVAVEPDERNVAALRANIAANGVTSQVTVRPVAVGGMDDTAGRLLADGVPGGCARVVPDPGGEVSMLPLTDLLTADVAVLKMDIEGGEWAAVRGVGSETWALVRYLAIEWHAPVPGQALGDLVQLLSETHHVDVIGRPSAGGMLYADRLPC